MGYSSKKPSLTYREVADQIFKRSGIPLDKDGNGLVCGDYRRGAFRQCRSTVW